MIVFNRSKATRSWTHSLCIGQVFPALWPKPRSWTACFSSTWSSASTSPMKPSRTDWMTAGSTQAAAEFTTWASIHRKCRSPPRSSAAWISVALIHAVGWKCHQMWKKLHVLFEVELLSSSGKGRRHRGASDPARRRQTRGPDVPTATVQRRGQARHRLVQVSANVHTCFFFFWLCVGLHVYHKYPSWQPTSWRVSLPGEDKYSRIGHTCKQLFVSCDRQNI